MIGVTQSGLVVLIAAAAFSAGLIVLLRPLLVRYAMARPNSRSSHREPTPQGGGIAVVGATLGISAAAIAATTGNAALGPLIPVFGAALLLAVVGAIDDIRALPAGIRIVLHALAFGAVLASLPAEMRVFPLLSVSAERALLLLGGVWMINLVNFMDGIDWMTVAETAPVTAGLALIGFLGGLPDHASLFALALLGAMLGFAPFNRPVARLFLGDVGSLPIGLLLGWLLVLLAGNGHYAAAVILPLYYLADATLTLLRRLTKGERVWLAHRTHFYQRATDHGFTVPLIVGRVFLTNLALVALSVFSVMMRSGVAQLAALAIAAVLVTFLLVQFSRKPAQ